MRTRTSHRRGRKPPRTIPVSPGAPPSRPSYPRGNPLTDWVELTDAAGTCWLAYVEPAPPDAPLRRSAAVLPGRRLRFDSLGTSLVVSPIPAGAPYLAEERLQRLLSGAGPVPVPRRAAEPGPVAGRVLRSVDWAASAAAAVGRARDALARPWQATTDLRRLCARGLVHLVAPAALLVIVVWEALLVRPRARI